MAVRTVIDPEGRTWRVRRKWLAHTVRWRGPLRPGQALDVADGADLLSLGDDLPIIGWIFFAVAVVLALVAAIAFVVPALVFAVELVVVLLLLLLGAVARILLRRPWAVEARVKGTNQGREWKVVGWRASGELVTATAERIRATGRTSGDITWSG